MMERTQIFDLMGELKLYGMRSAYDEVMAAGVKRQHEPPQIVGRERRVGCDVGEHRRHRRTDHAGALRRDTDPHRSDREVERELRGDLAVRRAAYSVGAEKSGHGCGPLSCVVGRESRQPHRTPSSGRWGCLTCR